MSSEDARVMVVDDNVDFVEALSTSLELDGYEVRRATTGTEALDACREFHPQCVLMDIAMPGLSGHTLCKRLREQYGDDLVFIAVTGIGREDDAFAEAFSLFDHYLRKPVDPDILRRLLPPLRHTASAHTSSP